MGKKTRKILALLLAAVMLTGIWGCKQNETPDSDQPEHTHEAAPEATEEAPAAAPDFTVYDEEGNAHKLSDFLGKPVILNFWATWCGPCKNELPEIQAAYDAYGDEIHFLIVDLADGQSETVEQAAEYIAQQGYTFPVYYDTELDGANTYGVSSIPITYFIDSEGYFEAYYLGSMDEAILRQGIGLLLGGELE